MVYDLVLIVPSLKNGEAASRFPVITASRNSIITAAKWPVF